MQKKRSRLKSLDLFFHYFLDFFFAIFLATFLTAFFAAFLEAAFLAGFFATAFFLFYFLSWKILNSWSHTKQANVDKLEDILTFEWLKKGPAQYYVLDTVISKRSSLLYKLVV